MLSSHYYSCITVSEASVRMLLVSVLVPDTTLGSDCLWLNDITDGGGGGSDWGLIIRSAGGRCQVVRRVIKFR